MAYTDEKIKNIQYQVNFVVYSVDIMRNVYFSTQFQRTEGIAE